MNQINSVLKIVNAKDKENSEGCFCKKIYIANTCTTNGQSEKTSVFECELCGNFARKNQAKFKKGICVRIVGRLRAENSKNVVIEGEYVEFCKSKENDL